MISFTGKYFDGKTSVQKDVVCKVYDSGTVHVEKAEDQSRIASLPLSDLDISARVAGTPRYLKFPDNAKLETLANDTVDRLVARYGRRSWLDRVHLLESRFKYVLVGLLLLLVFLWGSFQYGIPWAARVIANMLPPSILNVASQQSLSMLDKSVLSATELDADTHERLKAHFQPLIAFHADYALDIIFRKGGGIGPNAFALPDGTIIFTDEMVNLAEDDQELSAVLAHEIGHVVCRHGMRSIVQDSLLGFAILAITGDITGSSELFIGLPVLLTELAYSREFEREADAYALAYMQDHAIDLRHFANLMRRVEKEAGSAKDDGKKKWINYLSTHPMTDERLKAFE
jgi:Zn-dependent protease with chaperone function